MSIWFLFASGTAIFNSLDQVIQKLAILKTNYQKTTIVFISTASASVMLFIFSFFNGIPSVDKQFWLAVLATGLLNALAYPLILRDYQLGEFSSVYSMTLLTPVFLFGTSFLTLGEKPTIFGTAGVLLTILGVWLIITHNGDHKNIPSYSKGNLLGVLVAFIWSITANFDKIAVIHSDRFFATAVVFGIISSGQLIYLLSNHLRSIKNNFRTVLDKKIVDIKDFVLRE
ncbi:hypothetical protein C4572_01105 [Candidatus Parcubacteria bacterium]|nr:MAG: hypothetical protein C4572_01105 [Candidatus Parcubacteria bacterium]